MKIIIETTITDAKIANKILEILTNKENFLQSVSEDNRDADASKTSDISNLETTPTISKTEKLVIPPNLIADPSKMVLNDIPADKYLTITADDITIGGKSTTEYNGNEIWSRENCMKYVRDASNLFKKEYNAVLSQLYVVQANNVVGSPIPDTNGKCAWFRCVFNVNGQKRITPWIYCWSYGSVADCGSYCAISCGHYVRYDSSFRKSLFSSQMGVIK